MKTGPRRLVSPSYATKGVQKADGGRYNVALLIPQMRHGGAERAASRLYKFLEDKHNVSVVVFDSRIVGYGMEGDVVDIGLPPTKNAPLIERAARSFSRAKRYRRFKKLNGIDITYSFGDTANIVSLLSGGSDKKITSIRGFARLRIGRYDPEGLLLKLILKLISKLSDRVVVVSELMRNSLISHYCVSSQSVITIYNGYDLEQISEAASSGQVPEILSGRRYIVSVGTLRRVKRFDHLIRAFTAMHSSGDVALVIAGDDPNGIRQELLSLASELGVADRVVILPFQENPFPLMRGAETFVLSSESEGFPNVLVEAMSLGLPVVATDCKSGPREIIAPGTDLRDEAARAERAQFGWLAPPPEPGYDCKGTRIDDAALQLAEAVDQSLCDDETRALMSIVAKTRAARFGLDAWGEEHLALFEDVMKPSGRTGAGWVPTRCQKEFME